MNQAHIDTWRVAECKSAREDTKETAGLLRRLFELALPFERFDMDAQAAIDRVARSIEINQAIVQSVIALVVSEEGTIVGATPLADRVFGYAIGELAGRNVSIHELIVDDMRDKHINQWAEFWKRPHYNDMGEFGHKFEARGADGQRFWIKTAWGHPQFVIGRRVVVAAIMRVPSSEIEALLPKLGS